MLDAMPMSIRLGEQVEKFLEELVSSGRYPNKTDAVRAALNLLWLTEQERRQGNEVVAVSPELLRELRVATRLA